MQTKLLSISYLPPIEYFYHIISSKDILIEQFETYKKQSYRNRCLIYTEKGIMPLSIPVSKPNGNKTKTNEIEFSQVDNWQKYHWKAIQSAYQASPFFLYYKDDLEVFYTSKYNKLINFNTDLLIKLVELIGIETNISFTKEFIKPNNEKGDFRFKISPKEKPTISKFPSYVQVFSDRHGFLNNLSIIDLLFNLGPETLSYLNDLELNIEN